MERERPGWRKMREVTQIDLTTREAPSCFLCQSNFREKEGLRLRLAEGRGADENTGFNPNCM